jgi:hypothetical protein
MHLAAGGSNRNSRFSALFVGAAGRAYPVRRIRRRFARRRKFDQRASTTSTACTLANATAPSGLFTPLSASHGTSSTSAGYDSSHGRHPRHHSRSIFLTSRAEALRNFRDRGVWQGCSSCRQIDNKKPPAMPRVSCNLMGVEKLPTHSSSAARRPPAAFCHARRRR